MERQTQKLLNREYFEICRVCMSKPEDHPHRVYVDILNYEIKGFSLQELMLKCLGVEVNKEDDKPKIVCPKCLRLINRWTETKLIADESQRIIDCIVAKKSSEEELKPSGKKVTRKENAKAASKKQTSKFSHCKKLAISNAPTDGIRTKRKYTKKVKQNSQTSTDESINLTIEQVVSQNRLIEQHTQELHPSINPSNNNKLEPPTDHKIKILNEVKYNINEMSGSNEATSSQSKKKLLPCPGYIILDTNELVQVTAVDIENYNEIINDINMSSVSNMTTTDMFNDAAMDVVIHNKHGAISNKKNDVHYLTQYLPTTIKGRVDVHNEPNKSRDILKRRRCPKAIPFDNNMVGFDMLQTSELFNGAHLAVSNSKKRKCKENITFSELSNDFISDEIIDANEPRYCVCDQVAFGKMVACDNRACITEWYHYGCVGITRQPRGKWYCPKCKKTALKPKMSKQKPCKTSKK